MAISILLTSGRSAALAAESGITDNEVGRRGRPGDDAGRRVEGVRVIDTGVAGLTVERVEGLSVERAEVEAIARALRERRSIKLKHLRPDPVPLDVVGQMLEAANWAPNHGRTEPWRFVVFTGEGRRRLGEAFGEAYRRSTPPERFDPAGYTAQRDKVWGAPVWIAIGMVPGLNPKIPEFEDTIAVGCAVHNMQLVACAHGLGSQWTSGLTALHPHTAEVVGFEPPTRLLGFLYIGYPAVDWPRGERGPIADKVRWVEA